MRERVGVTKRPSGPVEALDPNGLYLRRHAFRVRDGDALTVGERRSAERNAQPLRKGDRGALDDPAVRDSEDAILLADAHRNRAHVASCSVANVRAWWRSRRP